MDLKCNEEKNNILLCGSNLFRKNECVYINKSVEMPQLMNMLHSHDFIEIAYVYSGEGVHVIENNEYETSGGDLYVINFNIKHGFFSSNDKNPIVVYNCIFTPEFLDGSLIGNINFEDVASSFLLKSLFPSELYHVPDIKAKDAQLREFGELFDKMYTEYTQMKKGYYEMLRAYTIEMIVRIFRNIDIKSDKGSLKNKKLVENALLYMKQNFQTDIKLEELAMQTFISKNYFSKIFKSVTGINFSTYLHQIRIEEACSLLKTTDMKVIDIAMQSGFNDIKFFYEVFKKITGRRPNEYRNK